MSFQLSGSIISHGKLSRTMWLLPCNVINPFSLVDLRILFLPLDSINSVMADVSRLGALCLTYFTGRPGPVAQCLSTRSEIASFPHVRVFSSPSKGLISLHLSLQTAGCIHNALQIAKIALFHCYCL